MGMKPNNFDERAGRDLAVRLDFRWKAPRRVAAALRTRGIPGCYVPI